MCKHYICEAHTNNIYGAENADWRSAAEARLATVLAAADGPVGDAAEGGRCCVSPAGTCVYGVACSHPAPRSRQQYIHASVCMYWLSGLCGVSPVVWCDRPRRAPPLSVVAYVGPVLRPSKGVPQTPL